MTCFNEAGSVRNALDSMLPQLNDDFEVVIVDNFSTDGTFEILREYEKSNGVKLVQKHCSRGLGRQIAFEHAKGDYIIANLDLDDVFLPMLRDMLSKYHSRVEGNLLAIFNAVPPPHMTAGWVQNITIGPRELIASIGGWRDLNLFEDWDIWSRAKQVHKYCWTSMKYAANETFNAEPSSAYKRLKRRYERYLMRLRLGMYIFSPGEKIGLSQRVAYIAAKTSMVFGEVLTGQDPAFQSLDPGFYVQLDAAADFKEATASRPN